MSFEILKTWKKEADNIRDNLSYLLEKVSPIVKEGSERHIQKTEIGFNIFELISNTYYRENFHTQVLSKFISPYYHREGKKMLESLINCFNKLLENKIKFNDFKNPIVENEKDNIDIRIRDKESMKSIIIENKINNAQDQYKQLPRYYNTEKEAGFTVVAIVYLSLVKGKKPSKLDWTKEEKQTIENLLIELPAFSEKGTNLCKDWIDPSIINVEQINVISTLKQYKSIIKKLTQKEMDKLVFEKFYSEILKDDYFQSALSIREMLGKLCEFRAKRIANHFEEIGYLLFEKITPFSWERVWRAKFENFRLKESLGLELVISIVLTEEKSKVCLYEKADIEEGQDKIGKLLHTLNLTESFNKRDNHFYSKEFSFSGEEDKMYSLVSEIMARLKNCNGTA